MTRPHIEVASRTLTGRRERNEDTIAHQRFDDGRLLVAVADGMGGHRGGDVASRMAVDTLAELLGRGVSLREAFGRADEAIRTAGEADPGLEGMGTTLVAAWFEDDGYRVANVGDSRAYRIDGEGLTRITEDHTWVGELVRLGQIEPEEAARSSWRHLLTQALGGEEEAEPDLGGPFPLDPPHILLLSSDGLHGTLSDEVILDTIRRREDDMEAAAAALTELAYESGSDDNISVVLARVG